MVNETTHTFNHTHVHTHTHKPCTMKPCNPTGRTSASHVMPKKSQATQLGLFVKVFGSRKSNWSFPAVWSRYQMIKDIRFIKDRRKRIQVRFVKLSSAVCMHADSALTDKGRPFLNGVHGGVALMREREGREPWTELITGGRSIVVYKNQHYQLKGWV